VLLKNKKRQKKKKRKKQQKKEKTKALVGERSSVGDAIAFFTFHLTFDFGF